MSDLDNFKNANHNIYPYYNPTINVTKEGKLFQRMVSEFNLSKKLIESFDDFIDVYLPIILDANPIITPLGVLRFHNSKLKKPIWEFKNGKKLRPHDAREENLNYTGVLTVTVEVTKPNGEIFEVENVKLGDIFIMVGSKYCHLNGKSCQELINMKECPNDPFGYFIVAGTEKNIVSQEKLRDSMFITSIEKTGLEGRYTCYTDKGTSIIVLSVLNVCKNLNSIDVKLYHMTADLKIPIFILFKFLGFSMGEALTLILRYSKPEYRDRILIGLAGSKTVCKAHKNYLQYWKSRRKTTVVKSTSESKNSEDSDIITKNILNEINRDTFPQIPVFVGDENNFEKYRNKEMRRSGDENFIPLQFKQLEKAKMLAFITAKMVETMEGLRPIDNRDSWSLKKVDVASKSYEQLCIGLLDEIKESILSTKNESKTAFSELTPENFDSYLGNFSHIFKSQTAKSFNAKSWGVSKSMKKENITDMVKRDSSFSVLSGNNKNNTPSSRRAPRVARAVEGSQLGIFCPFQTPDGENCGLVKYLSCTAFFSKRNHYQDLIDILNENSEYWITDNSTDSNFNRIFLINGNLHHPYNWVSDEIVNFLISKRQTGELCYEASILINDIDNTVEYNVTSSRPLRPLLRVNNGKLIIDELRLWGKSTDKLLKKGALELLDPREIEYQKYTICQFPETIREIKKKYDDLSNQLKNKKFSNEIKNYITIFGSLESLNKFLQNPDFSIIKSDKPEQEIMLDLEILNSNYYEIYSEFLLEIELKNIDLNKYSHCEISPVSMLSLSSSLIAFANHNQGPRIGYQSNMAIQAVNFYHLNHEYRMNDAGCKVLIGGGLGLALTETTHLCGLGVMPQGIMFYVLIMSDPMNMEDALIGRDEFFQNNHFQIAKFFVIRKVLKKTSSSLKNVKILETLCPPPEGITHINNSGLPIIGSYVKQGDIVVSCKRSVTGMPDVPCHLRTEVGQEGYVERVWRYSSRDGDETIAVKIGKLNNLQVGDKMTAPISQKGIISELRSTKNMPYTSDGIRPDLIINSLGQPSRMTVGMLQQMIVNKACSLNLTRANCTVFYDDNDPEFMDKYYQILEDKGYDRYGKEKFFRPDGSEYEEPMFFAPCTYQILKHFVDNKIQYRDIGAFVPNTRQPVHGRSNYGGLRIGEMERDAIIAHGASNCLLDKLKNDSDKTTLYMCKTCGKEASVDFASLKNKLTCKFCNENAAKFGTIKPPFVWKLIEAYSKALGISYDLQLETKNPTGERIAKVLTY